jgi:hypothetical protein
MCRTNGGKGSGSSKGSASPYVLEQHFNSTLIGSNSCVRALPVATRHQCRNFVDCRAKWCASLLFCDSILRHESPNFPPSEQFP